MKKQKLLSMLGMARKAGKLQMGFDMVRESLKKGQLAGVFLTRDCSEKTKKEMRFFTKEKATPLGEIAADMAEIEWVLHRRAGVLGVLDPAFFARLSELSQEVEKEECR